jgi:hypothetical protein
MTHVRAQSGASGLHRTLLKPFAAEGVRIVCKSTPKFNTEMEVGIYENYHSGKSERFPF